ncbi:MAG: hypothetical protein ACOVP4_00455 [Bacteriovoracaceae bacterium]
MNIVKFLFELFILKPFRFTMEFYVNSSRYKFAEIVQGGSLPVEKLTSIQHFRYEMYKRNQDYLIPKTEEEFKIEEDLDRRSYHAVVYDQNKEIIAATRLTPYPFETTSILGTNNTLPFKRYLEISRLICKKKNAGIGKRLLIKSGCFAIRSKKYDGFIAICRDENCSIFQKFGLKTIYQFNYSQRGSAKYNFICADFFKVSSSTFKHLQKKLIYRLTTLN